MHRFFVPDLDPAAAQIRLPDAEARHALRVLRLRPGAEVRVLNGAGLELETRVGRVDRSQVVLEILGRVSHTPPPCSLQLIQAMAKGPAMEGLLHRAVELGCTRLIPLCATRSVSRPGDAVARQARWQSLAHEALKQSGNPWRLQVGPPCTPAEWLARGSPPELLFIASLADPPVSPRAALGAAAERLGRPPASVAVAIGPEGDFTAEEYARFQAAGAVPFRLGPHVLRVETAATAALAILRHEVDALCAGDAGSPPAAPRNS